MPPREPQPEISAWDDRRPLLSVEEARARILSAFAPLTPISVHIFEALGLVLAEDVTAAEDVPPFRNSAMDGYAVRCADTASASETTPVRLTIRGEVPAGRVSWMTLESGSAVRIMTGAPVPPGADAVVRFEDVTLEVSAVDSAATSILVTGPARRGQNVRDAGEDVARGTIAVSRGTLIGAAHIGLLAALNQSTVHVIRRPNVAILATGDEVVDLGRPLQPGQIRNSNSYLLWALTRQFGGVPQMLGVAGDRESDITSKIDAGRSADLLVTSGGVSVGDFDMVKRVLKREGEIEFWQVRIKPGKPMAFGRIGETSVLGLPGNPVASAVAYVQFGRPAIRRMLGLPDAPLPTVDARLLVNVENTGRRRHFMRGIVLAERGELIVRPSGRPGSGALSSLAHANCFIVIPEQRDHVSAGETVKVQLFDEHLSV